MRQRPVKQKVLNINLQCRAEKYLERRLLDSFRSRNLDLIITAAFGLNDPENFIRCAKVWMY